MISTPKALSFAVLLFLALLFLFAHQFLLLGPSSVPISIRDELRHISRFRRTALAPSSPSSTIPRRKKIAFLFLTNSNLTFAPLWERFFCGNEQLFNIYVHADPTVHLAPPVPLFRGRFIPGMRTHRASPSLISATRRLLVAALHDDPDNYYFALLSQQCIPLHSFRFTYNALFYSSAADGYPRYRSFIEILSGEPQMWYRYVARGDEAMLPEVSFSDFRVGSQFFVLTRRHALLVVRERRLWRKFLLPCPTEYPCYPEEHYFPTLLSMEDPVGCTQYTLTRVNWTNSTDGHPHTYLPEEISPELIERLRKSNSNFSYLFARKFAPACLEPLMKIADSVILRD